MKLKMLGEQSQIFVGSLYWADNDLHSNVRMILFISAIIPSTTSSNERLFDSHEVKNLLYLRSAMLADRLNGLSPQYT